jgi:hypothetical protein
VLCVGVVESLVGLGVLVKNEFSRCTGVIALGPTGIVQLLMMRRIRPGGCRSSTLDVLAMYGLIACGHRISDS